MFGGVLPAAAAGAPSSPGSPASVYAIDSLHCDGTTAQQATVRGPPAHRHHGPTTAYDTVDGWSDGVVVRPTARAIETFDAARPSARGARATGTTGAHVQRSDAAFSAIGRWRVAAKSASGAEAALAGRNLGRQLASEQQLSEIGRALAGAGSSTKLRVAERLARDYGGVADDWAKMGSSSYRGADGFRMETHWYENVLSRERFEFKAKTMWLP